MIDFTTSNAIKFAERFEKTRKRRETIKTRVNPSSDADYVITLRTEMTLLQQNSPIRVTIRYVPDKKIMTPGTIEAYFNHLKSENWETLEDLATTITSDFKNELLTRWCNITIRSTLIIDGVVGEHNIFAEDRAPNWDNDRLLSRLDLD